MNFVKDHEELYDKTYLRRRPGRNIFGRDSPTAASCLSKCAIPKDSLEQIHGVQSGQAPKRTTER